MTAPVYDKDKAIPFKAPRRQAIRYDPEEIRIELPFPDTYEQFLYISKFWYEKWYTPTQYHDFFELCYVCEGNGWFILEGVMYPVKAGDLFLTKPGELHCGGGSVDSMFLVYAVAFRLDPTDELANGLYKLGLSRIVSDGAGELRSYFDRLLAEIEMTAPYGHVIARSCLSVILAVLLRLYKEQKGGHNEGNPLGPVMLHALQLIHSDTNYIGRIEQLAREVGWSRPQLDKTFKRHMDATTGDYVRGVWLERAKHLLRQSDEPVTGIAEQLQFESPQTFCMFFKRHVGLSPQQFRSRTEYEKR